MMLVLRRWLCWERNLRSVVALGCLAVAAPAWAGQEVLAGNIAHELQEQRVLAELPAAMAHGAMKGRVSAKPADAGKVWYVLRGLTTNRSAKEEIFGFGTLWVMAGDEKILPASASAFQPPDLTVLRSVRLAPGAAQAWVAFFKVPEGATGVALQVTNLDQRPRTRIVKSLPLPDARPGARLASTPPASAPTSAPTPARPVAVAAAAPAAARPAPGGMTPLTIPLKSGSMSVMAPRGATAARTADGAMAVTAPGFQVLLHPGIGMLSRKKDDVRADKTQAFGAVVVDEPPLGMIYRAQAGSATYHHVYYIVKIPRSGLVCSDGRDTAYTEAQARAIYAACQSVTLTP